jgi:hypothetical protein
VVRKFEASIAAIFNLFMFTRCSVKWWFTNLIIEAVPL